MPFRRWIRWSPAPLALASLLSIPMGCTEGRFPICHSNEECQARDAGAGAVCYNLRCVECHYDTDCPAGKVCNSTGACDGISTNGKPDPEEHPKGDGGWEPLNWDECAKGCKDQACLNQCDAKFHPPK